MSIRDEEGSEAREAEERLATKGSTFVLCPSRLTPSPDIPCGALYVMSIPGDLDCVSAYPYIFYTMMEKRIWQAVRL
jgi:hypothetical protein